MNKCICYCYKKFSFEQIVGLKQAEQWWQIERKKIEERLVMSFTYEQNLKTLYPAIIFKQILLRIYFRKAIMEMPYVFRCLQTFSESHHRIVRLSSS